MMCNSFIYSISEQLGCFADYTDLSHQERDTLILKNAQLISRLCWNFGHNDDLDYDVYYVHCTILYVELHLVRLYSKAIWI